ncbi:MAG TPA: anti-sigma factor [Ferruginibacter sp.]|nr:anti-sigma factor [Ferruginibacter sp.]
MDVKDIISSGVLELYVMGLASEQEIRDVETWAKQYPEVAAEINAIASGLESYAQSHAIQPGASVKGNVLAKIKEEKPLRSVTGDNDNIDTAKIYSISPAWKYAAAASIMLLIGSLIFNYTYYKKYDTATTDLQLAKTELLQQKELTQYMDRDMQVIGDMHAKPVVAKSIDSTAADMGAKIYWMTNTSEVYIDPANLPKAPEGKQYEFWAIVDGAPVNGGVITEIDGKKVHLQKMKSFGKAQAFAISLEDAGPAKSKPAEVKAVGNI